MTAQIIAVNLAVSTPEGIARFDTRMRPGLNVLNAPNSWGKSTLLQSIVFALGLEGSQSASRRSPLGPAMTTVVETSTGRYAVVESSVTLTLRNDRNTYLRVRRWGKSQDVGKDLLQVWTAHSEAELDETPRVDMFVREAGATTSRVGFHRLLAEFLGWNLPMVPSFNGREARLYLEVLFPLFYIEQKFGWSGIAPRIPTHYGIKEPLRRAVEYVLGLRTLIRLREHEALREEEASLNRIWTTAVARARGAADAENFRLVNLREKPAGVEHRRNALVEVNVDGAWRDVDVAEQLWRARIGELEGGAVTAGERTVQTRSELVAAEREVQRIGSIARNLYEQIALSRGDQDAVAARVASLDEDKKRLRDVKRIERLGGEMELPLLAEGRCPTCSQEVDNRDVVTNAVTSPDDNIALLESERSTLMAMQGAAAQRTAEIEVSIRGAESALATARDRVRLLRDELIGPSRAPSLAEVQERLSVQEKLRSAARIRALVAGVDEELDELAERIDNVRRRRAAFDSDAVDAADRQTLRQFRRSFQEQLVSYNLRSLGPDAVTIDEKTLLPVHDGFELTFDVAMGMSASDTIRTKWAYHVALMETAFNAPDGHHPGILMLDEPRQQETDRTSLASFLRRLRDDSHLGQVIYATSEDPALLDQLLAGIPYSALSTNGRHLIDFRS